MELNPYQSPVVITPTPADEQNVSGRSAPRPIGIWILSGVHLLAGLLMVAGLLIFLSGWDAEVENQSARPIWFPVFIFGFVGVVALATSVGMWLGARWGWWLTAFYYVLGVLGVVAEFLPLLWRMEALDVESLGHFLPGKLIRLAVYALLLLYLFKGTVRDFFRLKSLRMAVALMTLAVIAIVVLIAMSSVTYFQMGQ